MLTKDFLSIDQLTADELAHLLSRARFFKAQPFACPDLLAQRSVALLFQKPSLRTRVSFEMAVVHLGGHCLYLSPAEVGLGEREAVADVARVLSRYVGALVVRTYLHSDVEAFATSATVPVINGLSDRSHPCQILADLLTLLERFDHLDGLHVAYVGDGNNVARSLIEAAPLADYRLTIACPHGYEPDADAVAAARAAGGTIAVVHDAGTAVRDADVIYTDAWFSMGQEAEREARAALFPPFRVSADLLACAPEHAVVLHCLPAHRGQEITDEVLESRQSAVFDQAENRLHAQKALLAELLG